MAASFGCSVSSFPPNLPRPAPLHSQTSFL
jgi:hypothetical protein